MKNFTSYLELTSTEIILLVSSILFLGIQLLYWIRCYKKPLNYIKKKETENKSVAAPGVSVIVVAKENHDSLSASLPLILNQKYPKFEVIVVNIGFTEETHNLIQHLKLQHTNLYDTFLPYEPLEQKSDRKKLALTLGIKAAKNDILLFTEPDSMPDSDNWISSVMSNMNEDKDVVIGYCYYKKSEGFGNLIGRFDNLIYSMQYLASAITSKPYTGTYRNLAFRKELFFNNKGFSSSLNFEHSEAVFLNHLMNDENVAIALEQDSFISTPLKRLSKWESARMFSYKIKNHFSTNKSQRNQFAIEVFSRYLFYLALIPLLVSSILSENWVLLATAILLFVVKLSVQLTLIHQIGKYFKAEKLQYSFPFIELIQPFYNWYFKKQSQKKRSKL